MILLTPKQFIDKFKIYDTIVLGALNETNVKGLSNDFYVDKVLPKVRESIPNLSIAAKPITKDRTLWLISTKNLDKENIKQLNIVLTKI